MCKATKSAAIPEASSLAPGLLIAMPTMQDTFFARTVILLIEHNEAGAFGVVLNRKVPLNLPTLLKETGLDPKKLQGEPSVWWGGPVQPETGMLLYREQETMPRYEPDRALPADLRCSWSMELLHQIASGEGPEIFALFLGRSSWGPGQLESELKTGAWLPIDSDDSLLFTDEQVERWRRALLTIGARPANIAPGEPALA